MEALDLQALLEQRLARNMARAPTDADALTYRRMADTVGALFNLISDVAHQGPIKYNEHSRSVRRESTEQSGTGAGTAES